MIPALCHAAAHERDHLAPLVGELEDTAPLACAEAVLEHVEAFDDRGGHVTVAVAAHLAEQRFLSSAKRLGLVRKEVAETWYPPELRGHAFKWLHRPPP